MKVQRKTAAIVSGIAVVLAAASGGGIATAAPATPEAAVQTELRLGMSEAEALATGELTKQGVDDIFGCHTYSTRTFPDTEKAVVISPTVGVARITQPSAYRTPEGIGAGTTAGELRSAYPEARESRLGFTASFPVESEGYYVFLMRGVGSPFLDTDTVQRTRLEITGSECAL
jgi:hypothetical protein